MTSAKKRARFLTEEEERLWRTAMRDVARLRSGRARTAPENATPSSPDSPKETPPAAAAKTGASGKGRAVPTAPLAASLARSRPATPLGIGQTAGLDKRTAERLDKGRLPIEGRLDLHGMVQSAAHSALTFFIQQAWASDKRCVLVITGKGGRSSRAAFSDTETGVLRRSVPRWLNEAALRDKVLKFSYAQPKDGGEGALYILLRRRR